MSAFLDFNTATGCLSFRGELTIYEANAANEKLCQAFASGELRQIDLEGITEVDTAGLQLLVLARTLRTPTNEPVALVNHSDAVLEVLELTGLEPTS